MVGDSEKDKEIINLFKEVVPEDRKEVIMTIAERIEKRGKIEGRLEGEAIGMDKGKLEVAKKLNEMGYDIESISKITAIAENKLKELLAANSKNKK